MSQDSFIVGINYWPSRTAMFMWRHFDSASLAEDMTGIRELGFSCVRIFLLWEDFQPSIRQVSLSALDHLVEVAQAAYDCNLQILPTFFTGHMSGVNWLPPWMLESGVGSDRFPIFSGGAIRTGEMERRLSGHHIRCDEPELRQADHGLCAVLLGV